MIDELAQPPSPFVSSHSCWVASFKLRKMIWSFLSCINLVFKQRHPVSQGCRCVEVWTFYPCVVARYLLLAESSGRYTMAFSLISFSASFLNELIRLMSSATTPV